MWTSLARGFQGKGIVVRCTRLLQSFARGFSEHFAYLLVSKKVLLTYENFEFFSKIPPILKDEVEFFSDYFSFFTKRLKWEFFLFLNISWAKFQNVCWAFFCHQNPQFWKLKLEYFPIKNVFCKRLNWEFFFIRSFQGFFRTYKENL